MSEIHLATAWDENQGTTTLEFAMVAPVFITLVVGAFFLSMGLFAVASMHFAVQQGARCAALQNTTNCKDAATTISYVQKNYYYGPGTPTFSYDAPAACGYSISASMSYVADLGLTKVTIPFAATSCFPQ